MDPIPMYKVLEVSIEFRFFIQKMNVLSIVVFGKKFHHTTIGEPLPAFRIANSPKFSYHILSNKTAMPNNRHEIIRKDPYTI